MRSTGVEEGAAFMQELLTEAGIAAFGVAKEHRDESGARGFPVNEWFDWECNDARRRLKEALRREGSAVAEELRSIGQLFGKRLGGCSVKRGRLNC
jgi:hypothetical protein